MYKIQRKSFQSKRPLDLKETNVVNSSLENMMLLQAQAEQKYSLKHTSTNWSDFNGSHNISQTVLIKRVNTQQLAFEHKSLFTTKTTDLF